MKIAITRWPFSSQFGGEEQHTLQLVSGLRDRGHKFMFLGNCRVLLDRLDKMKVPVRWFGNPRPPVSKVSLVIFSILSPVLILKYFGLAIFLRVKVNSVIMMSLGEKLLLTPWCRLFGLKVYWIEHARVGNWLVKNPWFPLYKLWSRYVTTIVTSKSMLKFFPWTERKVAITCGIDKAEFGVSDAKISDLISQKLPGDAFLVGAVNRLTEDKGVKELVEAAKKVPTSQFLVIGEGNALKNVDLPKNFHLLGARPREDVIKLMSLVDVFILASTEEDPFGMVVAEAMTSGKPVIVTTACGVSGYLTSQKDAIVIKPKSGSGIANAILRLYNDETLRERLGSQGKETAEKEFGLERMIEEFDKMFGN